MDLLEEFVEKLWFEVQYISVIRGDFTLPVISEIANSITTSKVKPIELGVNTTHNDTLFDEMFELAND